MMEMVAVVEAVGNGWSLAVDWHCVEKCCEAVGYGLVLLAGVALRFGHRLHVAGYGLLVGLKVLAAVGG